MTSPARRSRRSRAGGFIAAKRSLLAILAGLCFLLSPGAVAAQEGSAQTTVEESPRPAPPGRTGLPLPRFVTLRAAEVNLRSGPGTRYPIDWVYQRSGMPVEIVDEFDTWRRIRDWQGTEGWVHQSMVQGQRGVLIIGERRTLKRRPESDAPGVALLDAGVVGELERCRREWCQVSAGGYSGWLERKDFYGLYPYEDWE